MPEHSCNLLFVNKGAICTVGEQTILLAERNATKPGFALLKLLNNSSNAHHVTDSCVQYVDGYYVASRKWTELFTSLTPNYTTHGPCSTTVSGVMEVDFAFRFKSDKLPEDTPSYKDYTEHAGHHRPHYRE